MSDEAIKTLWDKHDGLARDVGELKIITAVHDKALAQHVDQFRQMNAEQNRNHGQLITKMDTVCVDVKKLEADLNQRKGASESTSRQTWLAFSILGAIFTALNYFMP